jgi:hypothetical protein
VSAFLSFLTSGLALLKNLLISSHQSFQFDLDDWSKPRAISITPSNHRAIRSVVSGNPEHGRAGGSRPPQANDTGIKGRVDAAAAAFFACPYMWMKNFQTFLPTAFKNSQTKLLVFCH